MKWSEGLIAGEIARQTLAKKCVVLVDRCNWTGCECDVLGVTTDLRIIDVEVKISRSDLKADARKNKWWNRYARWDEHTSLPEPREWPRKVWKHYYALPADIWDDKLLDVLPSAASGVLLLSQKPGQFMQVQCLRRATPNRDADRLKPEHVMDIARLANLRMWDAYRTAEDARRDANYWRQQLRGAA